MPLSGVSADLRDVRELLGHASVGITTLYTKGDAVRQYRSVEQFLMRRWIGRTKIIRPPS